VRFRPDKPSVYQTNFLQPLKFFDTQSEQLLGFQLCDNPNVWWLKVAITSSAEMDSRLLWNTLRNIDIVPDTVDTQVSRIWLNNQTARGTQTL
jgi:hypothetical protein